MGLVDSIISGISGMVGSGLDFAANRETNAANERMNEANIAMTRETNAQNEALTRESWAREDNAVSRRAADLESAGLSKTLAAGSAAAASGAAQMESPRNTFGHVTAKSHIADVVDNALRMSQNFARNDADIANLKALALMNQKQAEAFDTTAQNNRVSAVRNLVGALSELNSYGYFGTDKPNRLLSLGQQIAKFVGVTPDLSTASSRSSESLFSRLLSDFGLSGSGGKSFFQGVSDFFGGFNNSFSALPSQEQKIVNKAIVDSLPSGSAKNLVRQAFAPDADFVRMTQERYNPYRSWSFVNYTRR